MSTWPNYLFAICPRKLKQPLKIKIAKLNNTVHDSWWQSKETKVDQIYHPLVFCPGKTCVPGQLGHDVTILDLMNSTNPHLIESNLSKWTELAVGSLWLQFVVYVWVCLGRCGSVSKIWLVWGVVEFIELVGYIMAQCKLWVPMTRGRPLYLTIYRNKIKTRQKTEILEVWSRSPSPFLSCFSHLNPSLPPTCPQGSEGRASFWGVCSRSHSPASFRAKYRAQHRLQGWPLPEDKGFLVHPQPAQTKNQ